MVSRLNPWRTQAVQSILLLVSLIAVSVFAFGGCSDSPTSTDDSSNVVPPSHYPPVPQPTSPLDLVQPETSDTVSSVVPLSGKQVDFVPAISDGTFTWNIDIQTQYTQRCIIGCPPGVTLIRVADPPGPYWNGTRKFSQLVFQGGEVNLTNLEPFNHVRNVNTGTQRIVFIEGGNFVQPRNPYRDDCWFTFWKHEQVDKPEEDYYKHVTPSLFGGYGTLSVEPGFFDEAKWRKYYVSAKSCGQLTSPIFVKRDRFWVRVLIDSVLKSIRVDPGNTFSISYQKTQGVSSSESEQFARTLDLKLGGGYSGVTGSIGTTLSETFSTSIEVFEQTSFTKTRTVTGIEGKTIIFSVWRSVEEYTITDSLGNPYTDVGFSFSDLGKAKIEGEYEWLNSAIFDLE